MAIGFEKQPAKTILLAEDDDGHARLIERNLSDGDSAVEEIVRVRDGQQALDFIHRAGQYADRKRDSCLVLLLDIKMPGVNGITVLEQIKSNPTTSWLPVVMMTTTDSPAEIKRCYELGCNAYLTKPVEYSNFVESLDRLKKFLEVATTVRVDTA